jgi:hypothetical protein
MLLNRLGVCYIKLATNSGRALRHIEAAATADRVSVAASTDGRGSTGDPMCSEQPPPLKRKSRSAKQKCLLAAAAVPRSNLVVSVGVG